ncbi:DNA-binding response regulator [Paenibacillus pectinilyticus]|uniref:DNA-binding response regulator n=1 Tax=Paenibacillus pectinilyticus TaxID=512399 RepID=A0A1C0ZT16_9BACL|nr:response regulator transcription factor [Paenibacillus pectinilyticus]OCT11224.1 DNA-binding response regulator [Paenibacillus pectinilyticus]
MLTENKIKVLLVDDQTLIRQGFGYVIGVQDDMELVGEAADGQEALEMAILYKPNVILMDVQMPRMTGIEATQAILSRLPQTKIVILTTFNDKEYIYQGIRAGAVGYLLKDAEVEDMLGTIRAVFRGEAVFRTGLAADVLSRVAASGLTAADSNQESLLAEPLTAREKDILQEMAYGLRNDQIAQKLMISEGTVKTHVHHILQKFEVEDRTQVVVLALRNGLVK